MKVRNKLFLLIGMIIGIIIGLTHLFNDIHLETYYFNKKKEHLLEVANRIKTQGINLDIVSLEEEKRIFIDFVPFDYIEKVGIEASLYTSKDISDLKDNPDKVLYLMVNGEYFDVEKLSLLTTFDEKRLLIVSTTIGSLKEPLGIITEYHMNIILLVALLGLVISWFISTLITRPLVSIEEVAHRVADLDFSKKLSENSQDEIGKLSKSINKMSAYLESNIRELNETKDKLELSNKSLLIEVEKGHEVDRMRKEFISNVSHELKTPIAIISNYTEGLIEGVASDKDTEKFYLEMIKDEASGMNKLVQSLLLLSKLERGYDIVEKKEVFIKDIIERELEKTIFLAEEKNIAPQCHLEEITFKGDLEKLTMVIRNFVSNSLKYTPEGGTVTIRLEKIGKKNRFEIYNTATLMEGPIARVWLPFYRGDKARNREEGTGLGLSIVREVLENHNFNFGVEKDEKGIRFWFEEER